MPKETVCACACVCVRTVLNGLLKSFYCIGEIDAKLHWLPELRRVYKAHNSPGLAEIQRDEVFEGSIEVNTNIEFLTTDTKYYKEKSINHKKG